MYQNCIQMDQKGSQRALLAQTINEIVKLLIEAHNQKKDVNLNRLKCIVCG